MKDISKQKSGFAISQTSLRNLLKSKLVIEK